MTDNPFTQYQDTHIKEVLTTETIPFNAHAECVFDVDAYNVVVLCAPFCPSSRKWELLFCEIQFNHFPRSRNFIWLVSIDFCAVHSYLSGADGPIDSNTNQLNITSRDTASASVIHQWNNMHNKNAKVHQVLVVLFMSLISWSQCVPSPFFDNIEGVSSRTVNMNDKRERKIILSQFNLTEEEFDRVQHNMAYNISSARASTPETWAEGEDYLKKKLRWVRFVVFLEVRHIFHRDC